MDIAGVLWVRGGSSRPTSMPIRGGMGVSSPVIRLTRKAT